MPPPTRQASETSPTRSPLRFQTSCGSGPALILFGLVAVVGGVLNESALAAAFGAILVAIPTLAYVLLRRSARQLKLTRISPDSAFEGDHVEVRIVLKNNSSLPLFYPEVREVFTPELHEQKRVLFPYRVRPGDAVVESYRGKCVLPRGEYALGPTAACVSDPFGWFQVRLPLAARRTLKVYPQFEGFGITNRSMSRGATPMYDFSRSSIGASDEFFSVREYRAGDPLRRVHWRLTAHRGIPVVREFVRSATGDLFVYLDLYRFALLGVGRSSSLEHAVRVTASLSAHALRQGHRVQVEARGQTAHRVVADPGAHGLEPILDLLVGVRPDGDVPYDEFLAANVHEVPTGSTALLMVNPYLHDSGQFEAQIKALAQRSRVILVVFDDATFQSVYEMRQKESGTARDFRARFHLPGVETVSIPCACDLREAFHRSAGALR